MGARPSGRSKHSRSFTSLFVTMPDLLTNSRSLPRPLVEAVRADDYSRGNCDYTTNQLIRPVRINSLLNKHRDQIHEDASDRIWTLFGQAIHTIFDRAKNGLGAGFITEHRYFMNFPADDGSFCISGQIDVYDCELHKLTDYKITSLFAVKNGVKPEWE